MRERALNARSYRPAPQVPAAVLEPFWNRSETDGMPFRHCSATSCEDLGSRAPDDAAVCRVLAAGCILGTGGIKCRRSLDKPLPATGCRSLLQLQVLSCVRSATCWRILTASAVAYVAVRCIRTSWVAAFSVVTWRAGNAGRLLHRTLSAFVCVVATSTARTEVAVFVQCPLCMQLPSFHRLAMCSLIPSAIAMSYALIVPHVLGPAKP
jgi:hypothetical protein